MSFNRILFIATSNNKIEPGSVKTGVWLESIASPYYIFKEAGFKVCIASPCGGRVPIDPQSQSIIVASRQTKCFMKDDQAIDFISHAIPLKEIDNNEFDAVFMPGGKGALWDLSNNEILERLLQGFILQNKPVAFLGEALVSMLRLHDFQGKLYIKGRRVTASTNSEGKSTGLTSILPLLIEDALVAVNALYSKGEDFLSFVVTDGNIISGQNPASAATIAKQTITQVENNKFLSQVRSEQMLNKSTSL